MNTDTTPFLRWPALAIMATIAAVATLLGLTANVEMHETQDD
jgi:hypothetical protein